MIRVRAGEREQRFHRVKPAHAIARLAAGGEFADVIVRVVLAAEKIAVERQDDFRLVEMEHRLDRLAKRLRGRALVDAGINRVVSEPLRFRKFLRDDFLQPRARRRGAAFREKRQTFAWLAENFLRQLVEEISTLRRAKLQFAVMLEMPRAVGIVKIQESKPARSGRCCRCRRGTARCPRS
jgi:hypothetical protein